MRRLFVPPLTLALLFMLAAPQAEASHMAGIRGTVTSANPLTFAVNLDVTAYMDGTYAVGANYGISSIQWGDGVTDGPETLTAVTAGPPARFTGSFSHVYPNSATRTITLVQGCCGPGSGDTLVTGNATNSSTTVYNTVALSFVGAPTLPNTGLLAGLALTMLVAGSLLLRLRPRLT